MPKPKTVTAGIYCRISSDPQGLKAGVERQERDCRKLARSRGWKVARTYVDNDLSAWNGKQRPEYARLLEDIESGAIEAVIVYHLDRLHRSPRELEEFVDVAQRVGLSDLATVTGDIDIAESDGLFQARILTAVARKSSDDSSRRIRRKMEDIAREGRPAGGGRRPFGFENDGMTVRKAEAAVVRDTAKRVLAGEGLFGIASDLNRRGVATSTGGTWSTRTLKRILTSPRWAGLREHKGEVIGPAAWPAILDKATHERLRGILLSGGRSNGGNNARKYLLPGIAYCKLCDGRLVSRPRRKSSHGENVPSYACISGPPYEGCGSLSVISEPLETLVRDAVFEALETPALMEAIRAAAGEDAEHQELSDAISEDEAALEQLARDHYADKLIGRPEFLAARVVLEERIEANKRSLSKRSRAGVLAGLPNGRMALEDAWETRGLEWRRALLGALIERVVVGPATVRGRNVFDPERVEIKWRA